MTTEAVAPQIGVLDVRDVRAALGKIETDTVEVLVAGRRGAFAGVVGLTKTVCGLGLHHTLVCPSCGQPKFRLYVYGGTKLGCVTCAGRLTRRAMERNLRGWRRLGGQAEDLLLRLVAGRGRPTLATLARAEGIAQELALGDLARGAAAVQRARLAIEAAEAT